MEKEFHSRHIVVVSDDFWLSDNLFEVNPTYTWGTTTYFTCILIKHSCNLFQTFYWEGIEEESDLTFQTIKSDINFDHRDPKRLEWINRNIFWFIVYSSLLNLLGHLKWFALGAKTTINIGDFTSGTNNYHRREVGWVSSARNIFTLHRTGIREE